MAKVTGPPTPSVSSAVSVTTAVVFSATLGASDEVNTGALSFSSVMASVKVVDASGSAPTAGSSTSTVTSKLSFASKSGFEPPPIKNSSEPRTSKAAASAPVTENSLVPKPSSVTTMSATFTPAETSVFSARAVMVLTRPTAVGASLPSSASPVRLMVTVAVLELPDPLTTV